MSVIRHFLGILGLRRREALIRWLARRADKIRDARRFAGAAEAYRPVLALAPQSADIRVRYVNMLRDSGRLAEAETVYRSALTEKPGGADIYLQLGHLLKLQGRRAAAVEAHGRAAELTPFPIAPEHQLFQVGQRKNREYLFEVQLQVGGVEALMEVAHHILELRATLSRLTDLLPDVQAQMAYPLTCCDRFRAIYDVPMFRCSDVPAPPKPKGPALRSFAILLLIERHPKLYMPK